jgi:hypothetical protein
MRPERDCVERTAALREFKFDVQRSMFDVRCSMFPTNNPLIHHPIIQSSNHPINWSPDVVSSSLRRPLPSLSTFVLIPNGPLINSRRCPMMFHW